MTTRLTLFTATLVQDSALSISGLDRESTSDKPFTVVDGIPVLSGRGLKGAAVAMARRFFLPLPRSVSDDANRGSGLCRSAWEFSNAIPTEADKVPLSIRAGVGILQKTGARASGVLYDLETTPAGTRWELVLRVDWSWAGPEGHEAEGILGYVLAHHWKNNRCWLGGNVARGLGWCHLENLRAYRLDETQYETWITSGRKTLPPPLADIPCVEPSRSWCLRSKELRLTFGEYRPNGNAEDPWGLDMLSVGPHSAERGVQSSATGIWARPSWVGNDPMEPELSTDRSIAMAGGRPLLPGASVRGPLRHTFSRNARAAKQDVQEPHLVQGDVAEADPAGRIFGSVKQSSRVLICDALADDGWAAARLQMHAEDEFSASSYGSAKRDAVRLLRAEFPVRILVEGDHTDKVEALTAEIDKLAALGALGHLPIGGHKTHGAGWGKWVVGEWRNCDVVKKRDVPQETPPAAGPVEVRTRRQPPAEPNNAVPSSHPLSVRIDVERDRLDVADLTLERAVSEAETKAGGRAGRFVAWWCEPTIDLTVTEPPETFGWARPAAGTLRVDEVIVFFERGAWRAARTALGVRWVMIREVAPAENQGQPAEAWLIPARLHGDSNRFAARVAGTDPVIVCEWRAGVTPVGFTLRKEIGQ